MVNITVNNETVQLHDNSKVKELIRLGSQSACICGALVDNVIKSLEYVLKEGQHVRLIDISEEAGYRIYESTLLLILEYAAHALFPSRQIEICYSLGGGIFCRFADCQVATADEVSCIKDKMQEIISSDLPILKVKLSVKDAQSFLNAHESITSSSLFDYCHFDKITLYNLNGFYGYYHTKTLSRTGEVPGFGLTCLEPGFVLLGVDPKNPSQTKKLSKQENIHQELQRYKNWCEKLDVSDATSLNRKIEGGEITNLITIAEARHEQLISKMAEKIAGARGEKRIVLISGPSCSGKTTTSKRLRNHLVALGLNPVAISLDDYFVDRSRTPVDENGQPDFESIEALDIDLFNANLIALLEGERVPIPRFNFIEGVREENCRHLQLEKGSPVIIEGIHGLNERLTPQIPKENKYKIYVNDLTHLNIDESNRIPSSDMRLLRRIVRDRVQRGHDALATIAMWQSVKKGEEKYIYPYSSEADFVFNSSLLYEIGVLKKYAEEPLFAINRDSSYIHEAQRLLDYLSFFLKIEDESAIYTNSILREFIGGNVYERL
ncbi:MAG: nucleoside kinase [Eubacteriaceae bacterium]|jgi:uridine kinase|nr:nucleoside kinase [Eubacteriaceae bacterium]